ncbi:MAG: hypothetical protein M3512_02155 [Bacteroidota bacterium]|nr:hypothetical protein [Bacteroidota bacterium]
MYARVIVLYIVIIIAACTSGKKAYQRGNYDEATLKAVNRLRGNPKNSKARETLYNAYNQSIIWRQNNISSLKQSVDDFRWEGIADNYSLMNFLYDQIKTCPACIEVVPNPIRFTTELDEARLKAAENRYETGKKMMANKWDRNISKEAFGHFSTANKYFPGFKDVRFWMDESLYYATLKVVVEKIPLPSGSLAVSSEFFENKIQEFLRQLQINEFVKFYTVEEARVNGIKEADHILQLRFDEFVVGNTHIKDQEVEVSKDSVIVGNVLVRGVKTNVYNTVKAKVRTYNKAVISTGILDFRVVDPRTKAVLTQEKLPGSFTWVSQWGSFNGDERALTDDQKKYCNLREVAPPLPQDLFIAFTQPIYGQITSKINHYYRRF